jgi:hypothetical protein
MKQFIVAIFLSVAFSTLVNAGQRKIAYEPCANAERERALAV